MTTDTDLAGTRGDPEKPYRYTPTLAQEIELGWQARWDRERTFDVPNPVGDLAAGVDAPAVRP